MQIQISWLLKIYTVCKGRVYRGSAGQGLNKFERDVRHQIIIILGSPFHNFNFLQEDEEFFNQLQSFRGKPKTLESSGSEPDIRKVLQHSQFDGYPNNAKL